VERLSGLATILKLNDVEAKLLFDRTGGKAGEFTVERFCALWAERHGIDVICCTLGPDGCFVYDHGVGLRVAGFAIEVTDTVGAGDAFAAGFLHGYSRGWTIANAARFANALGALVASRAGATPSWTVDEVLALAGTGVSAGLG
jgi:fructokinase